MSKIHIHRPHQLGLAAARKAAFTWAEKAEDKLGLECTYEEGPDEDWVRFARSGVQGTLRVRADGFELQAQLGLLVSAFKHPIETELQAQFDAVLLASQVSAPARKKNPRPPTDKSTPR